MNNIEAKSIEQYGHSFAKGLIRGFSEIMADSFGKIPKISKLAEEIFGNDHGKKFGSWLNNFANDAIKETGWKFSKTGAKLGGGINDFFHDFFRDLNMKEVVGDFIDEISKAFKEGITKMDMAGNMSHFASEFDEGMGIFRKNVFNQFDQLRGDIQSIFANIARDTALKTIPWIALGGITLVGAPLMTYYVYKKAVHNIGRPQLAQEVRKVGIWDRTTSYVTDTISSIWDSAKKGIQLSTLATVVGITTTVLGEITWEIITGKDGYGVNVIDGLACALSGSKYCDSSGATPFIIAAIGIGVLRSSAGIVDSFYNFVKKAIKKDDKPVFSDDIQKRIDDLTKATYNINRNGGYMQNLLLYGPGGTGKTMISKYIAKNSNMNYVMMSGGDLAQHIKKGNHVTELNKLFDSAKKSHSPTILFIDECESLCGNRDKMDRSELVELINAFLNQTSSPSKKIMLVLATNRESDLDPAILSRIDHKLYIGPPKMAERKKIIELYLPTFMTPLERKELFNDKLIFKIAKKTEGLTGRTIFKILNAIASTRATTDDNRLTEKMVDTILDRFVNQEAKLFKSKGSKTKWFSIPSFLKPW